MQNENKIRLLPETDLQPSHRQIVCIILGHWQQEMVPALSCWHNLSGVLQMHVSVQKVLFWSQWGNSLEDDKLEGGKKPSSLAMTAAARWVPPPLNRCVHKMWSRDVHLCLSDVCPLIRSCFDTVLGWPCDLIISNKGQEESLPHALQFAGYFVLKLG